MMMAMISSIILTINCRNIKQWQSLVPPDMVQAAREVENLVLGKIQCPEYVILCVEDTTDWKHATTRNIVTQVRFVVPEASSFEARRVFRDCCLRKVLVDTGLS